MAAERVQEVASTMLAEEEERTIRAVVGVGGELRYLVEYMKRDGVETCETGYALGWITSRYGWLDAFARLPLVLLVMRMFYGLAIFRIMREEAIAASA